MIPDLSDASPEFFIGPVQYERGFQFLWYLQVGIMCFKSTNAHTPTQDTIGSAEEFEEFIHAYLEKFSHQSITTSDFKEFFCDYFSEVPEKVRSVNWELWINGTGPLFHPMCV